MNIERKKYVFPKVPGHDFLLFRIMGSGLANCLFVYARAISYSYRNDAKLIAPTWFNIGIGHYIRKQKDKRHYLGLFTNEDEVSGFKKIWNVLFNKKNVDVVLGLGNYFEDILADSDYIASYIERHVNPDLLKSVNNYDFQNAVALHIRLGDYPERVRVPISWYKEKIMLKKSEGYEKFLVFSDGYDHELKELLSIDGVERVFFGNAIADIFAISKCSFLIGSDSTFSGWGAFLGQVPCVFLRKHFGPVLKDASKEIVEDPTNLFLP